MSGRSGSCKRTREKSEWEEYKFKINSSMEKFVCTTANSSTPNKNSCETDVTTYVFRISFIFRPVTVTSAECTYSKLKLIKTYLRSTMCQERLSSLATLSIERETVEPFDLSSIIEELNSAKSRYHRNNFKSTTPSKFEIKLTHQNGEAIKICSDLRESRKRLLTLLPDPSAEVETIQTAFSLYLSLVHGFIASIGSNAGPSKLRHNFMFKWTHSLLRTVPQIQMDMVFEVANMFCNVAIWYMKHAAFIAAKEGITMDQAKEVYKSLRTAAGMFSFVIKVLVPLLTEKPKEGGDLDPRVLKAYMDQCIAEAQEVTVARAIELKHKPSLISPLAHQTSSLFASAAKEIAPIKEAEKWRKYLLLKCELYLAYAFNYYGANLLELDKCGLAIRVLKECQACHSRSEQLCKEYGKIKGSGSIVKPESHPFFRKLSHITKLTLDKCERENGLIYHHRIPDELPELELKADYGLVQPDDFVLPSPSPLWTESSYDVMVQLGGPSETKVSNAEAKLDSYLPPVKEVNIPQSTSEPKTHSGCSIQ